MKLQTPISVGALFAAVASVSSKPTESLVVQCQRPVALLSHGADGVCGKAGEIEEYRRVYGLQLRSSDGSWEVRQTEDRGFGVFATRDIAKGTHIMTEAPMFTIDPGRFHAGRGYQIGALEEAVDEAFRDLNTTSREEYLACHEHRPQAAAGSRALFIFISNAYTMPDGRVGIFPRIAKINHSCRPNSVNTYSEAGGARVIWAGRDIAADEEISVTYVPLAETREGRQARLAQYGFRCGCETCASGGGDEARVEIQGLMRALDVPGADGEKSGDTVSKAERLVRLVEGEELVDYYGKAYRLATIASIRKGDMSRAKRWATKELEIHDVADDRAAETLRRDMDQLGL